MSVFQFNDANFWKVGYDFICDEPESASDMDDEFDSVEYDEKANKVVVEDKEDEEDDEVDGDAEIMDELDDPICKHEEERPTNRETVYEEIQIRTTPESDHSSDTTPSTYPP